MSEDRQKSSGGYEFPDKKGERERANDQNNAEKQYGKLLFVPSMLLMCAMRSLRISRSTVLSDFSCRHTQDE